MIYEVIQARVKEAQEELEWFQEHEPDELTMQFDLQIRIKTLRECAALMQEHKKHDQALELICLKRGIL